MKRILIIDDEAELRDEITTILKFEGFEVLAASDGINGIQIANDMLPDLIICDVSMPGLNGFELLDTLQQDSQTAFIPFIFLTAFADYENQRRGMALGADDYLSKPFLRQDLLNAIQSRLEKHQEQELHQLRIFSQSLVEQQENERKYLATQLQDNIGQSLIGLKVMLETSSKLPPQSLQSMLVDANKIVQSVVEHLQDITDELYPIMLQHLGLLPALYWYIDNFTRQTQIDVAFRHSDINLPVPQKIKLAAYRILQEALTNAATHAGVKIISVQVWTESSTLALHIHDEGIGFALESGRRQGCGLLNMHERALALQGECIILSSPNEGTQITVRLPLQPNNDMSSDLHTVLSQHQPSRRVTSSVEQVCACSDIMLVEENPLISEGIRSILDASEHYNVVDVLTDVESAIKALDELAVSVVLLSLTVADKNCFEMLRRFTLHNQQTSVIVLSPYAQDVYVRAAFEQGASGYLLKNADGDEILNALEQVLKGNQYYSESLSIELEIPAGDNKQSVVDAFATLTRREKEIFYRVVDGMSNQQIADELVISPRTVETHRSNMMHKLGVRGQAALMHYALNRGLIAPNKINT